MKKASVKKREKMQKSFREKNMMAFKEYVYEFWI